MKNQDKIQALAAKLAVETDPKKTRAIIDEMATLRTSDEAESIAAENAARIEREKQARAERAANAKAADKQAREVEAAHATWLAAELTAAVARRDLEAKRDALQSTTAALAGFSGIALPYDHELERERDCINRHLNAKRTPTVEQVIAECRPTMPTTRTEAIIAADAPPPRPAPGEELERISAAEAARRFGGATLPDDCQSNLHQISWPVTRSARYGLTGDEQQKIADKWIVDVQRAAAAAGCKIVAHDFTPKTEAAA